MNSGKAENAENEKKFHEFEAHLKSLVDAGEYAGAMDFYEKNHSVTHNILGDSCTFYSFKIVGVCDLKTTQKTWYENGYKPSQWMAEGDRLFDTGDYKGAIEVYYKAIGTDSDKAWYSMGCAYRAMGNPYESVDAWDEDTAFMKKERNAEALESDPNNAQKWAERGNIDYNLEKWRSAISSYNNSLAIDPDQPGIWFRKGCSHFEDDEYHDALAAYKKVLELKPDHFRAANNSAVALWKLGHFQQEMEYLDQAARYCPPDSIEYNMIEGNKKTVALPDRKGKSLTFLC
jgi:tetratricopeptide (TPR) repeat protein